MRDRRRLLLSAASMWLDRSNDYCRVWAWRENVRCDANANVIMNYADVAAVLLTAALDTPDSERSDG